MRDNELEIYSLFWRCTCVSCDCAATRSLDIYFWLAADASSFESLRIWDFYLVSRFLKGHGGNCNCVYRLWPDVYPMMDYSGSSVDAVLSNTLR